MDCQHRPTYQLSAILTQQKRPGSWAIKHGGQNSYPQPLVSHLAIANYKQKYTVGTDTRDTD